MAALSLRGRLATVQLFLSIVLSMYIKIARLEIGLCLIYLDIYCVGSSFAATFCKKYAYLVSYAFRCWARVFSKNFISFIPQRSTLCSRYHQTEQIWNQVFTCYLNFTVIFNQINFHKIYIVQSQIHAYPSVRKRFSRPKPLRWPVIKLPQSISGSSPYYQVHSLRHLSRVQCITTAKKNVVAKM